MGRCLYQRWWVPCCQWRHCRTQNELKSFLPRTMCANLCLRQPHGALHCVGWDLCAQLQACLAAGPQRGDMQQYMCAAEYDRWVLAHTPCHHPGISLNKATTWPSIERHRYLYCISMINCLVDRPPSFKVILFLWESWMWKSEFKVQCAVISSANWKPVFLF